jgi:NAD(P)H-dependent flavin oxidoreductase YrpB (nitropropane dioxygenase family)
MTAFLERMSIELPIVQAGMGGGLAMHPLAAAVSEAGGLGTIGFLAPDDLRREIDAAREATRRPIAVNLLLPFTRRPHWDAVSAADVVVTFWGRPRRRSAGGWVHQCGSVEEALAAHDAGADAVIAQGVEAGGHVRGDLPALELLARARDALPGDYPVLSAGGLANAEDVRARLDAGAAAAVLGTRFLLTPESGAHPDYRERLIRAERTTVTELFGAGWPVPHRVVPNAATERWLRGDPRGPLWLRSLQRATAPALARVPAAVQLRMAGAQRPGLPIFGPAAALADGPDNLLDAGPLYAGESVARISELRPAADLVRELAGP